MYESDDDDPFDERFEGMSKEEFQEWLYDNRHLFGEILEEFEEFEEFERDSECVVEYEDGVYRMRPFGACTQKFAELTGDKWICFTN